MTFSLIICSRKGTISRELEINIRTSIGSEYELHVIDNSQNHLSIYEAYNQGMNNSRGQILVFLHDDIQIKTKGWGKIIERIFEENEEVGLLGIAGNSIKSKMPSTWWTGPGENYLRLIQYSRNGSEKWNRMEGFGPRKLAEVAVIDGFFMVMRKDERIAFNEGLGGFHNYDLDLSLKHHEVEKKVAVTCEVIIEHFSPGKIDRDWYLSASRFHKFYINKLPVIKSEISKDELENVEFFLGAKFLKGLLEHGLRKEALYWWIRLLRIKLFAKFHGRFLIWFMKSAFLANKS